MGKEIFEVWHYPVFEDLSSKYIDTITNLKVANSGWPRAGTEKSSKTAYLKLMRKQDNVIITMDQIRMDIPLYAFVRN